MTNDKNQSPECDPSNNGEDGDISPPQCDPPANGDSGNVSSPQLSPTGYGERMRYKMAARRPAAKASKKKKR